ncbi:MAG: hypothetical protein JXX28_15100 [Deltaproteobacteria bacterium]|nr:hypothetical protein [Deltaproteobacteria bacterium]
MVWSRINPAVFLMLAACGTSGSHPPCWPDLCPVDTGPRFPPEGTLTLTLLPALDGVVLGEPELGACGMTLWPWDVDQQVLELPCGVPTTVPTGTWSVHPGSGYYGGVTGLTEVHGGVLVSPRLNLELWPDWEVEVEVPLNRFVDGTFTCTRWEEAPTSPVGHGALVDEVALGPWHLVVDRGEDLLAPDARGWETPSLAGRGLLVSGSRLALSSSAGLTLEHSEITTETVSWEVREPEVGITAMHCERTAD